MKRSRPKPRTSLAPLLEAVAQRDGQCVWAGHVLPGGPFEHFCRPGDRFDPHHLLPAQRIRRHHGENAELLLDPRNAVLVCRFIHELLENARIYLSEEMLPAGFQEFCDEHPELSSAPTVRRAA